MLLAIGALCYCSSCWLPFLYHHCSSLFLLSVGLPVSFVFGCFHGAIHLCILCLCLSLSLSVFPWLVSLVSVRTKCEAGSSSCPAKNKCVGNTHVTYTCDPSSLRCVSSTTQGPSGCIDYSVYVHYHRNDKDYSDWTLHLWNGDKGETTPLHETTLTNTEGQLPRLTSMVSQYCYCIIIIVIILLYNILLFILLLCVSNHILYLHILSIVMTWYISTAS